MNIIDWILRKIFKHVDIVKKVDGKDEVYLRRYFIFERKRFKLYLHHIRRSDDDPDPHDHPWDFTTLILRGGYTDESYLYHPTWKKKLELVRREKLTVGSLARRKAEHIHQVKLFPRETAWTLVFLGRHRRDWGFWKEDGFHFWREYLNFWDPDPFDNEALK